MECPTIRQITEKLGWFRNPSRSAYDLAIYGGGPAGLSAAVYGASEGLKTVLIERYAVGGQAGSTSKIENYLGFPAGISGAELAERTRDQASRFGTEILLAREGVRAECSPRQIAGYLADGTKIVARATICATGVTYRRLGLPNEERFLGAGLYYGYTATEMLGHSIAMIVPAERLDELAQILERLKRGEHTDHYETERVRKDGLRLHTSLTVSPIMDAAGTIVDAATIVRDITERKRAEEELLELKNRLAADLSAMTRLHDLSARRLASTEERIIWGGLRPPPIVATVEPLCYTLPISMENLAL